MLQRLTSSLCWALIYGAQTKQDSYNSELLVNPVQYMHSPHQVMKQFTWVSRRPTYSSFAPQRIIWQELQVMQIDPNWISHQRFE